MKWIIMHYSCKVTSWIICNRFHVRPACLYNVSVTGVMSVIGIISINIDDNHYIIIRLRMFINKCQKLLSVVLFCQWFVLNYVVDHVNHTVRNCNIQYSHMYNYNTATATVFAQKFIQVKRHFRGQVGFVWPATTNTSLSFSLVSKLISTANC